MNLKAMSPLDLVAVLAETGSEEVKDEILNRLWARGEAPLLEVEVTAFYRALENNSIERSVHAANMRHITRI